MTIEDLEIICDGFPGVTKDIKWEHHLCFNIGGKMFLVTAPDLVPPTATFKVTPDEFEEIIARDGFCPASHVGRYFWASLNDISKLSYSDWEHYALQSYLLVASKLTKKQRTELGIPII
jgi:predicted DNA-binding protein (MmcQ/YjbR family)